MNEEDTARVKLVIATQILNQMTLNHLLDSAKVYASRASDQHFEQMSDEDKQTLLDTLNEQEKPSESPAKWLIIFGLLLFSKAFFHFI